jgi:hypothetical protein
VRIISYRHGTLFHGVAFEEDWARICAGAGLQLPARHAHDVGDYGYAVYLTTDRRRARVYAGKRADGFLMVRASVVMPRAILLNWRISRWEGEAWDTVNELARRYGDPLHGSEEARAAAARRWRTELLREGIDGIVAVHDRDTEVAVYQPKESIVEYQCFIDQRPWRAVRRPRR